MARRGHQWARAWIFLVVLFFHQSSSSTTSRPPLRFGPRFNTIVQVSSSSEVRCALTSDPGVSLTDYMTLPSAQYVCIPLPARAQLTRVATDEFVLSVPAIHFFFLECLPRVFCSVTTDADAVTIRSSKCILGGSAAVERLNAAYKFSVTTRFRWVDKPHDKRILSTSDILVFVDPPPPFNTFPRPVLESTGNFVMQSALDFIEKEFIRSLANDYARWASSADYRERRARNTAAAVAASDVAAGATAGTLPTYVSGER